MKKVLQNTDCSIESGIAHYRSRPKSLSSVNKLALVVIVFALLFVLQPSFVFLTLVFSLLLSRQNSLGNNVIVSCLGSLYLGLINCTKVPESDLRNYLEWFAIAQNFPPSEFLLLYIKEPIYSIYLSGIANLPGVSEQLFIFVSTVITYGILLTAMIRVCVRVDLSSRTILFFLIVIIFFTPMFNVSAHLMRQFMAASLVIFFYAETLFKKKPIWILVLATLVHTSAIIFLAFFLTRRLQIKHPVIWVFLMLIAIPAIYFSSKYFATYFSSFPILGYTINRIATSNTGHDYGQLSLLAILFSLFIIILSVLSISRLHNMVLIINARSISSSAVFLGIVVLISNLLPAFSEIATRFYFYLYFLFILIFPIFLFTRKQYRLLLFFLALLSPLAFFINLEYGIWQYAPLVEILTMPAWRFLEYTL